MSDRPLIRVLHSIALGFLFISTPILLPSGTLIAQVSWTNPGPGDWYDGTNWSGAAPPSLIDATLVNNGGQPIADHASLNYLVDPQTASLGIGHRTSPILPAPNSTGHFFLVDVDLDSTGAINIGVVDSAPGPFLTATGSLVSAAGGFAQGNVNADGDVIIGSVQSATAGSQATGLVDLSGALTGNGSGDLIMGQMFGGGSASGTADISGDVSGFDSIYVGHGRLNSTGAAQGVLSIGGIASAPATPGSHHFSVSLMGADGSVDGSAVIGAGLDGFNLVSVGSGGTVTLGGVLSSGFLQVLAGGISATDGYALAIGGNNGAANISGDAQVVGDINGLALVEVGHARLDTTSGYATGLLTLTGSLVGTDSDDLIIAQTFGGGTASGTADISGDVSGFDSIYVGHGRLNSTGAAQGVLSIGGIASAPATPGSHHFSVSLMGADGSVDGSAVIGAGLDGFNLVSVGSGGTVTLGGVLSSGFLQVLAGGISATDGYALAIGGNNGAANISGDAQVVGDINGLALVEVGHARLDTTSGYATGLLTLTGSLVGTDSDDLIIAQTFGGGTASGTADISGDVSGFVNINVGITMPGSTGSSQGSLAVNDGLISAMNMNVGIWEGAGPATGIVDLDQVLTVLSGDLALGSGSDLIMHIDGLFRGSEYAAIDANSASLNGTLDVLFEFTPPPGAWDFDLIRTTGTDIIAGGFQPGGVTVTGLPAEFTYAIGIVSGQGQGAGRIYRLSIDDGSGGGTGQGLFTTIPTLHFPAMLLLAIGILLLGTRTLRRSRI